MSLSLPELFSMNHQVIEVLREAVSSTELLHERAMERFYRAVAVEEAELAKKNETLTSGVKQESGSSPLPMEGSSLFQNSLRLRNAKLRRRPSSTGSPGQVATNKVPWNRRRSSEGQTSSTKLPRGLPETLLLPMPQLVASDPNLPKLESEIENSEFRTGVTKFQAELGRMDSVSGSERSQLHRWDEKSMPLVPTESDSPETKKLKNSNAPAQLEESYEDKDFEGMEESESEDDLKLLKSRILAQPIVDEEDTYHPRGRPTAHVPSPETPVNDHRGPTLSNNVSQQLQPKSILKKRTEDEPVPVNRFGRPIPPEMPVVERQTRRIENDIEREEIIADNMVTLRKKSLPMQEVIKTPELSEMDKDNANLLSVAEVARSRRRLSTQKPALPTKTSFEEEEELQARMAVIDHYTEIVREYSMAHSVHPSVYQRSNTLPSSTEEKKRLTAYESVDKLESDRADWVSPRSEEKPTPIVKKEDIAGSRKNSVGSRGTTPTPDVKMIREPRLSRRVSRNESPAPRSRNVSTERAATTGSRSSSKTRNREVSQDRSSAAPRSTSKTRNRDASRDRKAPASRSSSKTRNREASQERSSTRLRKERSVSRTRNAATYRSVDVSPSDSETSSRITGRKKNASRKTERMSRGSSRGRRVSMVETENGAEGVVIDERLAVNAAKNIRSTMSYVTDLTILIAAAYVYLFKKEMFAVPLIGLLLYRRIQQDIRGWIPKRWRPDAAPKR